MIERKVSEIDTFAQWTQTHYKIDIQIPENGTQLIGMKTTSDRVENNKEILHTELLFKSSDFQVSGGSLHQSVLIGQSIEDVIIDVNPDNYTKCFDWDRFIMREENRPSGLTIMNTDCIQLRISGTPVSDDTIIIPPLMTKHKINVKFTDTNAALSANTTEQNLWFINSANIVIKANDGYRFSSSIDINSLVIEPESMKSVMEMNTANNNSELTIKLRGTNPADLSDVSITIPALELGTYKVEVQLGENTTNSGGELTQDVTIGQPMAQIDLSVDNTKIIGSFSPDVHNTSKDGISINTDTSGDKPYTKAWISGTPLRNTSIEVPAPTPGYLVNVTGGANTTHISGGLRQYVNAGESIETVIFRCNDGYWFGKYNGGSNNQMSIKLNPDKTELTLSGAPASMNGFGSFDVRLEDAVKKPVTLTVNLPADGSVKVKAGEEANLNQTVEFGEYIEGITLVPKDANYKMTQAWRKTIKVEPTNEHIMIMTSDTETYISGTISENTVITVPAIIGGGIVVHSDTFNSLVSYEGRWWTEWQLSDVTAGAEIKYIRNILTETGPKNVVLYVDNIDKNSYFSNIPYGLEKRFAIQFNNTKKIPMIWMYSDSQKSYYSDLDYDMFCIDIGNDAYANMSKPCVVRYWSRPYWYILTLPASGVVNGDPVKLTLTCYGDTSMFNPNKATININPDLKSSLQVQVVTPFTSISSNTYEATIKFTGTRGYTYSYDIVYVEHLDEVATVGIQLLYSGSV